MSWLLRCNVLKEIYEAREFLGRICQSIRKLVRSGTVHIIDGGPDPSLASRANACRQRARHGPISRHLCSRPGSDLHREWPDHSWLGQSAPATAQVVERR